MSKYTTMQIQRVGGRHGDLMVSALDSGASSPDWGHCIVFLGETFYSHPGE